MTIFRSILDEFFACSLMNSRLLAVHMMTQFSFGTSWIVHPQRAHHSSSRTCSNSTLAPQHARTLTSQSNYGQWWLFQTPHNQGYISFYLQNLFFWHKWTSGFECRIVVELHITLWVFVTSGLLLLKFQTNCSPVSKVIFWSSLHTMCSVHCASVCKNKWQRSLVYP